MVQDQLSREKALSIATEVRQAILTGSHKLSRTAVKDLPLLAHLPLFFLGSKAEKEEISGEDISAIDPKIYDIFIFGSTTTGKESVSDVDLIVIDTGFFSNFLGTRGVEYETNGDRKGSLLEEVLTGWCKLPESQCPEPEKMKFVDLIFLPRRFFKDPQWRKEFSAKQQDPNFLKNAFSSLLRYEQGKWIPVTIEDLERKYCTKLEDLR